MKQVAPAEHLPPIATIRRLYEVGDGTWAEMFAAACQSDEDRAWVRQNITPILDDLNDVPPVEIIHLKFEGEDERMAE